MTLLRSTGLVPCLLALISHLLRTELHHTVLRWTSLFARLQVLQSQAPADRRAEAAGDEEPEAPEREVSFASIAAGGNSVPFAGFAPPVNAAPKRPPRQPAGPDHHLLCAVQCCVMLSALTNRACCALPRWSTAAVTIQRQ